MSGNADHQDINFTVDTTIGPTEISGGSLIPTYEKLITTVPVIVKSEGINLAGIDEAKFSMQLNGNEKEITVFDYGDGNYNLSFYAPDHASDFDLTVKIDSSLLYSAVLRVNDLYMSAAYSETGIASRNTTHITYSQLFDNSFGLASDESKDDLMIVSGTSNLSLTNLKMDENLFIFNTKSGLGIASRENLLDDRIFLKKVTPSFGYQLDDSYVIRFILRYDSFAIESQIGDELNKGIYNILAKNDFTEDGRRTVTFKEADEDAAMVVN
jgi:hypothetical protein